ncbi:aminotransferase [Eubacteriales bacterium OttesenSCG-928-K08]|nr:aminotransferase [Eubacteriales bacterium OttesenSCG-928-K08]
MKRFEEMNREELLVVYQQAQADYSAACSQGLKLDMSRGKPGIEQLALSDELLKLPALDQCNVDGIEARNYGVLAGLPSCRKLFAQLLGVQPDEVFVGGNASLTVMYDIIAKAFTHGLLHSNTPWSRLDKVKFICPVPGYDRHFAICESFGMEMITAPMLLDGPDMDKVEELIKDPSVKGMWCVPKFSNPDGMTYSEAVIRRIAKMKPAAPDFLLMWDNAYCVHEFDAQYEPIPDILGLCREYGNPDMAVEFASTSKITLPGAGVSCFACSLDNMAYFSKLIGAQSISYDKVNQLRHVLFLKDKEYTLAHMEKHAAILKPRFDIVLSKLDEQVEPLGIAHYFRPRGGYFVSLYAMPGTAKRVHALMKNAGVVMTGAGATYPHGNDPQDSNLRIAPSFPSLDELAKAMDVLCVCLRLAAAEKTLGK